MKIRIFKEISGGKFRVNILTEDFSEEELRRIDEQGDPEVEVGGDFTAPVFELPTSKRPAKAGFSGEGYTKSFDGADFGNAQAMADSFATEIETRIFAAMQVLKDNDVTDFEGESVNQVTYS